MRNASAPCLRWQTRRKERHVTAQDRLQVVRECFGAYESGDRRALDEHLAADFTFFSPYDVGIDRERYFERCWANAGMIEAYDIKRLAPVGDEVLVTYESTKTDGSRFRNTEIFGFAGEKIRSVEVYFGWDLPSSR
jgi:SnoaL-like domain